MYPPQWRGGHRISTVPDLTLCLCAYDSSQCARVAYEDRAAVITDWEQRGIPGLLQTEDYARAVIRACRPYDPPEALEHEVRSRLERQDILTRDDPRTFGSSSPRACSGSASAAATSWPRSSIT